MTLTAPQIAARDGKSCEQCGQPFFARPGASPSEFHRTRFCSRVCGNAWMNARRWAGHDSAATLRERFEAKVIPEPNSGCHLWLGAMVPDGYGIVGVSTKHNVKAHRVAWQLYRGPVPKGMHVLHRCDTRLCVNPDHLFLGDNAANVADKVAKGRQARGNQFTRAETRQC